MGHDQLGVGHLQLLEDLRGRVEGIGGGGDGPDHGRSHEAEHEFGAVLEEDHHHIPLLQAQFGQPRRRLPANKVGLRVGVDSAGGPRDQAGEFGGLGEILEEVRVEREVVVYANVGEPRFEDVL
uniref:Uncharacterized protein n=1 Tax=Opuntia streptacantha TaxID=393608 RepID=A0A7C9CUW7_OPUST